LIKIFTSLRLTVILLAFAILLVFIGTLAQVDEGLYNAQARYFRQWIIFGLDLFGRKIPLVCPAVISSARCCCSIFSPRTFIGFSFQKENRDSNHALGRHFAARRPACGRHDGA